METITISEAVKLLKGSKAKAKPTKAELIAGTALQAALVGWEVLYEPFEIILRTVTYTPDWVAFGPDHQRIYVEVKESAKATKWRGYRIQETLVKLHWLKEKVEPWGHRVILLTVEAGRIKSEREIE